MAPGPQHWRFLASHASTCVWRFGCPDLGRCDRPGEEAKDDQYRGEFLLEARLVVGTDTFNVVVVSLGHGVTVALPSTGMSVCGAISTFFDSVWRFCFIWYYLNLVCSVILFTHFSNLWIGTVMSMSSVSRSSLVLLLYCSNFLFFRPEKCRLSLWHSLFPCYLIHSYRLPMYGGSYPVMGH
jgi:hypothetical protein